MIRVRGGNRGGDDDFFTTFHYIINRHEINKSIVGKRFNESVELLDHTIENSASVDKSYESGISKRTRITIENPSAKCFNSLNLKVKKLSVRNITQQEALPDAQRQSFLQDLFSEIPLIDIYNDDYQIASGLRVVGNSGLIGLNGRTYIIDAISRNDLFISDIKSGRVNLNLGLGVDKVMTLRTAHGILRDQSQNTITLNIPPVEKYPKEIINLKRRVNIAPTATLQQIINHLDDTFGTFTNIVKHAPSRRSVEESLEIKFDPVTGDVLEFDIPRPEKEKYSLKVKLSTNLSSAGEQDAGTFSYRNGTLHASPHVEGYTKMVFTTIFNPRAEIFKRIKISVPEELYRDTFRAFPPPPADPNRRSDPVGDFLRRGEIEIEGVIVEYNHVISPTERKTNIKAVTSLGDKSIPVRAILERVGGGLAIFGDAVSN